MQRKVQPYQPKDQFIWEKKKLNQRNRFHRKRGHLEAKYAEHCNNDWWHYFKSYHN